MSEQTGRQPRRQATALWGLFGAFLLGLLVGAGSYIAQDLKLSISPVLIGVGCLAFLLLAMVSSIVYWRNIDEAAREAHKFAWFWGGSSAMLAVLPIPFLIGDARLVAMLGQRSPVEWMTIGVVALLAAQLIGYALVWAGWWLRQR